MAMTRQEKLMKYWLMKRLISEGYVTYAKILKEFDIRCDDDPNVAAYMIPGKGIIAISPNVDDTQASLLVRHEILHEYLRHEQRLIDALRKKHEELADDISKMDTGEMEKALKNELYQDKAFNIAGDYEISNRGYTEKDKQNVRNLILNGRVVSGLVTEDDHPDWVDLTVEEMYDRLRAQQPNNKPDDDVVIGAFFDDQTFVGFDGVLYGV